MCLNMWGWRGTWCVCVEAELVFLLTLKGVLTCGVYHLRVCFDCLCVLICTYKTESICGHIKVVTHPEHIGRDFLQRLCFHCGRPSSMGDDTHIHRSEGGLKTHTHTRAQSDWIYFLIAHWPGLQNQFNPDNHLKRRVFIGSVSELDLVKPK